MKKLLLTFAIIPLLFSGCYLTTVDSGEVGVKVSMGSVSDDPVNQGLAWNPNPMTTLTKYNIKAKRLEMSGNNEADTFEVMNDAAVIITTKDNLQVPVDITILYKLDGTCAPHIRTKFGTDVTWDNSTVVPVARAVTRDVISKDADIYSLNQNREEYSNRIINELTERVNTTVGKRCISIEMVAIRDIHLPKQLTDSIMVKNQMEEQARTAELQVKRAEAEAKIEIARAEGTAKAQLALAKSITPEMIKWRELENSATAIAKWNGALPTTNASSVVPFINIK